MVQWPTPLSQGHYLGISEENTMVPGIGRAPRKGNHSGSPEVVPADPWVRRNGQQHVGAANPHTWRGAWAQPMAHDVQQAVQVADHGLHWSLGVLHREAGEGPATVLKREISAHVQDEDPGRLQDIRCDHREACPGTQVFGSHQQGIEGGPSAPHTRLRVLHGQ